jgi:hypothetical protein
MRKLPRGVTGDVDLAMRIIRNAGTDGVSAVELGSFLISDAAARKLGRHHIGEKVGGALVEAGFVVTDDSGRFRIAPRQRAPDYS